MSDKIPTGFHDRRKDGENTLRQCQLTQLHLLYVLDEICRRHNLKYWLAWGSCIGAARHKGFIPWDDDLDIGLHDKDFKKLMKVLPLELPDDVELQTPKSSPRLSIAFPKVRDTHSFYAEVRSDITMDEPNGIYVDIFPFEEIPNVGRWFSTKLIHYTGASWHRKRYFLNQAGLGLCKAMWCVPAAFASMVVNILLHAVRYILLWVFGSRYTNALFDHGDPFFYRKEWFADVIRIPFEDGEFPVPIGYEEYLNVRYGDWKKIPSPEQRPFHARIIDPFHSVK